MTAPASAGTLSMRGMLALFVEGAELPGVSSDISSSDEGSLSVVSSLSATRFSLSFASSSPEKST